MHKGLLFDLDGVIVDTAKYHYIAWKEIADELGVEFTPEHNERLKGVSRGRSFEIILEIGGIAMPAQQQLAYCTRKNEVYLSYIRRMGKDEILPGVRDFLQDAKRRGYKIALGSASKNSREILARLELAALFDAIVDGTRVAKAKPDPEVFANGAQELALPAAACLVFEDAVAGIQAAHNAGMLAVGVGTAAALPEADCVVPGFAGITIADVEGMLAGGK